MPIKTNQEKATEDTHRRIKKKVKKYKKRIKKNASMTPQVARNTRADAAKYPAYTPFAYRPADSPTHILKSKNDLIKIINQDLHNERIQMYELETDISRLQHQRDMANKRKQDLEITKRERLKEKLKAEELQEFAKRDYETYKQEKLAEHRDALATMHREADKAIFNIKMFNEKEILDKKMAQQRAQTNRERQLLIERARLESNEKQYRKKLDTFKRAVDKFRWEGMYNNPDSENPTLKLGAKQLQDEGIDFKHGERDLIRERHKFEIEKIARDTEKEMDHLRQDINKYQALRDADENPDMKRLQQQRNDLLRQMQELEVQKARQQKNAKVEEDNRKMQKDIAVLQAQQGSLDPALGREYVELSKQVALERWKLKYFLDNVRMRRQLAEMNAVQGHVSGLNQMRAVQTARRHAPRRREEEIPLPTGGDEDGGDDYRDDYYEHYDQPDVDMNFLAPYP